MLVGFCKHFQTEIPPREVVFTCIKNECCHLKIIQKRIRFERQRHAKAKMFVTPGTGGNGNGKVKRVQN